MAEPHWDRYRIASRGVTDPQAAADLMLEHFTAIVGHDPRDARGQLAVGRSLPAAVRSGAASAVRIR